MKKISVLILACLLCMAYGNDSKKRIDELLPLPFHQLNIEPVIPSDFIAMSPSGSNNLYDWVYWGPEEALKAYFKNPKDLKSGLIRVKLSGNVAQTGPHSFSGDMEAQLKEVDPNGVIQHLEWGDYPVVSVSTNFCGKRMLTAWMGLNDRESGWTLMFNLVYPDDQSEPSEKELQLWETFISQTCEF